MNPSSENSFETYILHLADNALVLAQRNAEWCGHGPVVEQDIAITNISLDLLGQARNFYQYVADLLNKITAGGTLHTEDSLAYLREERAYLNCLLTELPRGDWAQTILRQYLFSQYQLLLFTQLREHADEQLAAIAAKSLKEIQYHTRWSSEWVIRLGDGTAESNNRIRKALEELWPYTGEMFRTAEYEIHSGIDLANLQQQWLGRVKEVLEEATLTLPENIFMHGGGKQGLHTEHMGYLLTELQYMQRAYPGASW